MTSARRFVSRCVLACALLLLCLQWTACSPPRSSHIVIGAKNFTEQVILGELLAQEIEASGGGPVERRFWLAGSYLCQQALLSNRIDAYVEYSGTALMAVLKLPVERNRERVLQQITSAYQQRYHLRVGPPLGFEDTFALVVRRADADRLHLASISDLTRWSPPPRLGVGYEFSERPDGLAGLSAAYSLHFAGTPRTMELGLLYRALQSEQVDVVAGNSTDGAIEALNLVALADDRHYFPPYDAVPLVREEALQRWPAISLAESRLAGRVTAAEMRSMNLAVDHEHRDVAEVVRAFRAQKGL